MDSVVARYIEKLCSMNEDEFTREILKPLFESMGYESVDFNGGPYERGRDLIAKRRMPPRRRMHLVYVQSKKIGKSQTVKDSHKISQLVHQLRQCCKKGVTDLEGNTIYPDEVYLACPEQLRNRFMEELEEQFFSDSMKVQPYDGPCIIDDIKHYNPSLLDKLGDIESKLTDRPDFISGNNELLSALKSNNESGLSDFYSDLSFFVGSFDSNALLHLGLEFKKSKVEIHEDDWGLIKDEVLDIQKHHGFNVLLDSIDQVESKYLKQNELYLSEENIQKNKEYGYYKELHDECEIRIKQSLDSLGAIFTRLNISSQSEIGKEEKRVKELYSLMNSLCANFSKERLPNEVGGLEGKFSKFYQEIDKLSLFLIEKEGYIETLGMLGDEIVEKPKYQLNIDIEGVKHKISEYKERYFSGVEGINSGSIGFPGLKDFLSQTEKALSFISRFRDESFFLSQIVRFSEEKEYQDRVSISPHDVFYTGHDIAVYGGAGVGKTTTLYAYADKICSGGVNDLIIVPLNKLVDWYKEVKREPKIDGVEEKHLLEKLVLMSKGFPPSPENLDEAKRVLSKGLTLILDGLDEVYNAIPEIIPAISEFKRNNPSSQLIVSSRDCVSYLKDIDFLGVTLLPFTEEQLKKFISGWLKDSSKSKELIVAVEERGLYQYIKTPLLATITCSLVEKGISIPSTEYEIYAERLRLLTGEYDLHKKIERQKNKGDTLRKCAIKIGYYMHSQGVRSLGKERIVDFLHVKLGENYEKNMLNSCFEELVDPCGVLIFDPVAKTYTFGHFRFQEYLASEELKLNRGLDLVEFVCKDWWRGALCLYSQQSSDISHIIEDSYNKLGSLDKAGITLREMINNGQKSKIKNLNRLLRSYEKTDSLERMILGEEGLEGYDDFSSTDYF